MSEKRRQVGVSLCWVSSNGWDTTNGSRGRGDSLYWLTEEKWSPHFPVGFPAQKPHNQHYVWCTASIRPGKTAEHNSIKPRKTSLSLTFKDMRDVKFRRGIHHLIPSNSLVEFEVWHHVFSKATRTGVQDKLHPNLHQSNLSRDLKAEIWRNNKSATRKGSHNAWMSSRNVWENNTKQLLVKVWLDVCQNDIAGRNFSVRCVLYAVRVEISRVSELQVHKYAKSTADLPICQRCKCQKPIEHWAIIEFLRQLYSWYCPRAVWSYLYVQIPFSDVQ